MESNVNQRKPAENRITVTTTDLHTAGEPLRVITGGLPSIPGSTILEKRRYFRDHLDAVRKLLMWEPRGHADMYGAVITDPVTPDGDFGTFFLHNEGYSTMCGHAMIALVKYCLETGMVVREGDTPEIRIDAPPGRITAFGRRRNGRIIRSGFRNVPSFVLMHDRYVEVAGFGRIRFDVAYGGAFYAFIDARDLGFGLVPEEHSLLIDAGRKIKRRIMEEFPIIHPFEPDLGFLYGTIFVGPARNPMYHSRNVCVFADGEIDRSPTGSGVSARAALHRFRGELEIGEEITIESLIGSTMTVKICESVIFGPHDAVIPEVWGTASFTGSHEFYLDPDDEFPEGFFLK